MKKKHPYEFDVIVVGSGVAGLFAALKISRFARVCLMTKSSLRNTGTCLAQGGIAAAIGNDDLPGYHLEDTLLAGAGLCNKEMVEVLVREAPQRIEELVKLGMPFDRGHGKYLSRSREGAHSRNRILHAGGDATGRLLQDILLKHLLEGDNITVYEHTFVTDLYTVDGRVCGVITLEGRVYRAGAVLLATGGIGRVYSRTTNPDVSTGDGLAMAYRAGAEVADMEFVQFHPTVFPGKKDGEHFLVSEAVRGEGALLRNARGELFMHQYHQMAELGPRDVVARAILDQMKKCGSEHVYLDITHREPDFIQNRFPTIYRMALVQGVEMSREWLPVAPAAHYAMGGVRTGFYGETGLPGLYACGEVACSGVHGANRLASNSLLEGLVFAHRIAAHLERNAEELPPLRARLRNAQVTRDEKKFFLGTEGISRLRGGLRVLMFNEAGILRHEKGLLRALRFIRSNAGLLEGMQDSSAAWELKNLFLVAELIVSGALTRKESRGCHYRTDYPEPSVAWSHRRIYRSVGGKKEESIFAAFNL